MTKVYLDYMAALDQPVLDKLIRTGKVIKDELGYEKLCKRCETYWPLTSEFWYGDKKAAHGTHCWCIACYRENRKKRGK